MPAVNENLHAVIVLVAFALALVAYVVGGLVASFDAVVPIKDIVYGLGGAVAGISGTSKLAGK